VKKLLLLLIIPFLSFGQTVKEKVYTYKEVDKKPTYPFCEGLSEDFSEQHLCFMEELTNHIAKNKIYPKDLMHVYERIMVEFIISKNGDVKSAKVTRGDNRQLKKEALRVVYSLPKMRPGKINGEFVDVSFLIVVNFSHTENSLKEINKLRLDHSRNRPY
tara:strand:- start:42 stop:521 length:480 start_codon:yes stop_codon:yes gene_type:complete